MNNQNLELIRQKCIEANPEIVELKFGCVVKNERHGWIQRVASDESHPVYENDESEKVVYWAISLDSATMRLGNEDWKIIGRPIRLADVLLAIEKSKLYRSAELLFEGDGIVSLRVGQYESSCAYDLRKDDLNSQSEETIDFFANLLR
jgi:hypothetical protein